MRYRRLASIIIGIAFATGCDKTFTGTLDLSGTVRIIGISGNLDNSQDNPTILRARVLLDGNEIFNSPVSPAVSHMALFGSFPGNRGHHTLIVVVAEQTSSPTSYRMSGLLVTLVDSKFLAGGSEVARTTISDRTAFLSSGQELSFPFDL